LALTSALRTHRSNRQRAFEMLRAKTQMARKQPDITSDRRTVRLVDRTPRPVILESVGD
jgi:hypothetical protein